MSDRRQREFAEKGILITFYCLGSKSRLFGSFYHSGYIRILLIGAGNFSYF